MLDLHLSYFNPSELDGTLLVARTMKRLASLEGPSGRCWCDGRTSRARNRRCPRCSCACHAGWCSGVLQLAAFTPTGGARRWPRHVRPVGGRQVREIFFAIAPLGQGIGARRTRTVADDHRFAGVAREAVLAPRSRTTVSRRAPSPSCHPGSPRSPLTVATVVLADAADRARASAPTYYPLVARLLGATVACRPTPTSPTPSGRRQGATVAECVISAPNWVPTHTTSSVRRVSGSGSGPGVRRTVARAATGSDMVAPAPVLNETDV